MKKFLAMALFGMFACTGAQAMEKMSQQDKMKSCNAEAAGKKGDERKAFMKDCLSAQPAKAESKMSMCNKKTAGMKGDDRKKAQSECMKG